MPLTTAQYERRRLALQLAAQTSRGDDCETDVRSKAETFLAFLEGRDGDGEGPEAVVARLRFAFSTDDLRDLIQQTIAEQATSAAMR